MLEFYTLIPELIKDMPIEKARIKGFQWYKNMVDAYLASDPKPHIHTSRCPGILGICSMGWVQRTYQDFTITTNGDGKSFEWHTQNDQKQLMYGELMENYISHHPPRQLFDFGQFKKDTLETIIKIQSPWTVKIPEGYTLLEMPIPYSDCNHFTSAIGVLKNYSFCNVQLFWHTLNEEVVIKKGTPLCQYLLIKDEEHEAVLKVADRNTMVNLHDMYISNGDPGMSERCYPYILENSRVINQFIKSVE